jgi:glycosyltransferase involved in cell wall biosynthesis
VHDSIDLTAFDADQVQIDYLFNEFNVASKQTRYGIFGRIVDWKGIREFIYAARLVANNIPHALAFIVGSCSDGNQKFMDEMAALVEELGLSQKVIFTGYRHDVPALMKFMDIVVHASNRPEPFGMVLIEAMAMRKPVVATRGGGPMDIVIHGETGLLVEMGDSVALGEAICSLLALPDLQEKMGHAGLERVKEHFDSRRNAQQMKFLFQAQLARSIG